MGSASSSQIPGRKSSSAVSKVSGLSWLAYGLARRLGLRHWRDRFVYLNFRAAHDIKQLVFHTEGFQVPGTFPPVFFLSREQCENSASSSASREAMASPIATICSPSSCATNRTVSRTQPRLYESALCAKGLLDIPFHASPLMNDRCPYRSRSIETRCSSSSLRPLDLRRCTA